MKRCIETGLEQNYSIRIIRNEQQISDNNATPGNAVAEIEKQSKTDNN